MPRPGHGRWTTVQCVPLRVVLRRAQAHEDLVVGLQPNLLELETVAFVELYRCRILRLEAEPNVLPLIILVDLEQQFVQRCLALSFSLLPTIYHEV